MKSLIKLPVIDETGAFYPFLEEQLKDKTLTIII